MISYTIKNVKKGTKAIFTPKASLPAQGRAYAKNQRFSQKRGETQTAVRPLEMVIVIYQISFFHFGIPLIFRRFSVFSSIDFFGFKCGKFHLLARIPRKGGFLADPPARARKVIWHIAQKSGEIFYTYTK